MFSFSPTAVSILSAFGAIAVLWALALIALGRQRALSRQFGLIRQFPLICQGVVEMGKRFRLNSASRAWRGKITSPSEKMQPFAIREKLLRLMMIFERPVVDCFSFLAKTFASFFRRLKLLPKLGFALLETLKPSSPKIFSSNKFLPFFNCRLCLTLKRLCFFKTRLAYVYVRVPRDRQI